MPSGWVITTFFSQYCDYSPSFASKASISLVLPLLLVTGFLRPCLPHRLYDKEGQGFISMDTLRGLISELLAPLTEEELEGILEELDEDGSGSMDFDEFCEMMMTKPED